jgi:hypothetical protein
MTDVFLIFVEGQERAFVKPGRQEGLNPAFIYGATAEELSRFIAPWPRLRIFPTTARWRIRTVDDDEYVLPAGGFRLYLDLCTAYGVPP